jgi:hypothetical protein
VSHYAKLATIAFRFFGVTILLYAVPYVLLSLVTVAMTSDPAKQPPRNVVLAWMLYAVVGIVLVSFGRPLGRFAARGLDEGAVSRAARDHVS